MTALKRVYVCVKNDEYFTHGWRVQRGTTSLTNRRVTSGLASVLVRADVLTDTATYRDGETTLAWYLEGLPFTIGVAFRFAVENDRAAAIHDVHSLGGSGAKMVGPRVDEAECLLRLVGKKHSVANDLSVEVSVGLREDGYGVELRWVSHIPSSIRQPISQSSSA